MNIVEPYETITWFYVCDSRGKVHRGFSKVSDSVILILTVCKLSSESVQRLSVGEVLEMDEERFCQRCLGAV